MQLLTSHGTSQNNEKGVKTWQWRNNQLTLTREMDSPIQSSWCDFQNDLFFTISEQAEGQFCSWGELEKSPLSTQPSLGADPCHFCAFQGGWVIAHYSSGSVTWLQGEYTSTLSLNSCGPILERQEKSHIHFVSPSPCGQWILATDLGGDCIWVLGLRDQQLWIKDKWILPPGTGPRHFVYHQDSNSILLTAELSDQVLQLFWDPINYTLSSVKILPHKSCTPLQNYPSHLILDESDSRLWVAQRGRNTIDEWGWQNQTWEWIQSIPTYVDFPRHFCWQADTQQLLVAGQRCGKLAILQRSQNQWQHLGLYEIGKEPLWVGVKQN